MAICAYNRAEWAEQLWLRARGRAGVRVLNGHVFALRVEKMKRAGLVCYRLCWCVGAVQPRRGVDGPATGHLCPSAHPSAAAANTPPLSPFTSCQLVACNCCCYCCRICTYMSAPFGLMECVSFVQSQGPRILPLAAPLKLCELFRFRNLNGKRCETFVHIIIHVLFPGIGSPPAVFLPLAQLLLLSTRRAINILN